MRKMDILFLIISSLLLLSTFVWIRESVFVVLFASYLFIHGMFFMLGWKIDRSLLRFMPSIIMLAGLVFYLLQSILMVINGGVLTVLTFIFLIPIITGIIFSASLSLVLERLIAPNDIFSLPKAN